MLAILIIFISPRDSASGDLSWCEDETLETTALIRCTLWQLVGFMRLRNDEAWERSTGPVAIGPGRWAQASAFFDSLHSSWPDRIHIQFSDGYGPGSRSIEEIKDQGLDGLKPDDPGDAYLRYGGLDQPSDLLVNIDPNLIPPVNQDYLARLREVLNALSQRDNVHAPLSWQEVRPGLEMTRLRVFRFVRFGDNDIFVLRMDPGRFQLVPHSYRELVPSRPLNIEGWGQARPEAAAVFNAGQYYPDYRYMGLLKKDGENLGTGLHPKWMALLLSGETSPAEERPSTAIVDLEKESYSPDASTYRFILQSFMLLDRDGRPRVRQTDSLASRTVVAQDQQDRILIIFVPGACTLYELALLLHASDLEIEQAMCLDGGFESQAFVRTAEDNLVLYGAWVVNDHRQFNSDMLKIPLPAVIAVEPVLASPTEVRSD